MQSLLCSNNNINQKVNTWSFATKFYVKKAMIDISHKGKPSYGYQMTELGSWTRSELINLGPTFIKLGQIASSRQDIFCREFVEELTLLQDSCPPIENENIIQLIESELQTDIRTAFATFNEKPYKAASIGQVHNAKLHSGVDVVVKIQRPKMEEIILNDISTIRDIFTLLSFLGIVKDYNNDLLQESEKYLMQEIDYINEANNAINFRKNFHGNSSIIVPRINKKYSTKRLLIMERVDGRKITELKKDKSRKLAVTLIIECFLEQLIVHGFIHGDPHPGNMAYVKEQLVLYDFGLVIDVSKLVQESFDDILLSLIQKDSKKLTNILIKSRLIYPTSSKPNIELFFDTLFQMFKIPDSEEDELFAMDSIEILNDLGYDDSNRPFALSNDLIYLGKSLSLLDGICRQLDPDYKPLKYIQPYIENKLSTSNLNFDTAISNMIEMPTKINNINSSILSIEKTTYSMKAKTKKMKNDMKQTQALMMVFFMYYIYTHTPH